MREKRRENTVYIDGTVSKAEGKPLRTNTNKQFLQLSAEGHGPVKGDHLWSGIGESLFTFFLN